MRGRVDACRENARDTITAKRLRRRPKSQKADRGRTIHAAAYQVSRRTRAARRPSRRFNPESPIIAGAGFKAPPPRHPNRHASSSLFPAGRFPRHSEGIRNGSDSPSGRVTPPRARPSVSASSSRLPRRPRSTPRCVGFLKPNTVLVFLKTHIVTTTPKERSPSCYQHPIAKLHVISHVVRWCF